MRQLTQGVLVGVLLLAMVSLAVAQQVPPPVVRLGHWIEVGNELCMHNIATSDSRYKTAYNLDFQNQIRDQAMIFFLTSLQN